MLWELALGSSGPPVAGESTGEDLEVELEALSLDHARPQHCQRPAELRGIHCRVHAPLQTKLFERLEVRVQRLRHARGAAQVLGEDFGKVLCGVLDGAEEVVEGAQLAREQSGVRGHAKDAPVWSAHR